MKSNCHDRPNKERRCLLSQLDPEPQLRRLSIRLWELVLECSATRLDDLARRNVRAGARNQRSLYPEVLRLQKRQAQYQLSISASAPGGTNLVADMPAHAREILVEKMANGCTADELSIVDEPEGTLRHHPRLEVPAGGEVTQPSRNEPKFASSSSALTSWYRPIPPELKGLGSDWNSLTAWMKLALYSSDGNSSRALVRSYLFKLPAIPSAPNRWRPVPPAS